MNLYHLNTGVDSRVLLNADYDIRRYTDFISNAIKFLEKEPLKLDIIEQQADNEASKIRPVIRGGKFANEEFKKGMSLFDAAMAAAKSRFRPILMTAFSFILGVFPLVVASGTGAEARKVMGMALLGGMTLATFLGVFLYPLLFVFIGKIAGYEKKREQQIQLEQDLKSALK